MGVSDVTPGAFVAGLTLITGVGDVVIPLIKALLFGLTAGVAVLMSFFAARFGTTFIYGQSTGVYDHYFNTFLIPTDLIWSFLQATAAHMDILDHPTLKSPN